MTGNGFEIPVLHFVNWCAALYVVGILVTHRPSLVGTLGSARNLERRYRYIVHLYIGISIGGIFAGVKLAQLTRSRKLTMMIFLLLSVISVVCYLRRRGITAEQFIWLCSFMVLVVWMR